MNILLTGGAGFIGTHVIEHLLKSTDHKITILDRLDTSGCLERLKDCEIYKKEKGRVRFIWHDLKAPINPFIGYRILQDTPYLVWHLGAGTHVDRSIINPIEFVQDNVLGTANLLEWIRSKGFPCRLTYFSTDEIFGPAPAGTAWKEWDRYKSANPYAATKAGAEELCVSYANTYRMDVTITHCMNVFGERQHPEKFVPLVIKSILNGDVVKIHADPTKTIPGSRHWIHARNVADALCFLSKRGLRGSDWVSPQASKWNIVGEERSNLEIAEMIASFVGKPLRYELVDFHSSRPGHDLRYALDGSKMREAGWVPPVDIETALERVVRWTLENREWLC